MKRIFTHAFLCIALSFSLPLKSQLVINELYTDPGSGKSEFFELFNYGAPTATDNLTLLSYFDSSGIRGFYVLDIPAFTLGTQNYFVGVSAYPFNYQGVVNSTAAQFNWNDPALSTMGGSLQKWVIGTANPDDGNAFYDQMPFSTGLNDFFYKTKVQGSPSFSVFLYKNGVLMNTLFGGGHGTSGAPACITSLPPLNVDMLGASPDFTISFSTYGNIRSEWYGVQTGTDNGYTRTKNGLCKQWTKAAAGVSHTPGYTNGSPIGTGGSLTIAASISRGKSRTDSSYIDYDITAGTTGAFPVDLLVYLDNGSVVNDIDTYDQFLASNTENVVTDGGFRSYFLPAEVNNLLMAKSPEGCLDQVILVQNVTSVTLPLNGPSFHGHLASQKVFLQWQVDQNKKWEYFEVQESSNGTDFSPLGIVFSTEKNGEERYAFQEKTTLQKGYYRLQLVAPNKTAHFSKTILLKSGEKGEKDFIRIAKNPAGPVLNLTYFSGTTGRGSLTVYSVNGSVISRSGVALQKGPNPISLPLNENIKEGMYIVEVANGLQRSAAKFIKQ